MVRATLHWACRLDQCLLSRVRPYQRFRNAVSASEQSTYFDPVFQPTVTLFIAFCCFSHVYSGWKYSIIGPASRWSSPVIAFNVSCHGLDCPASSIVFSFAPASLLL